MRAATHISIERRRLACLRMVMRGAALIEALKSATYALKAARIYQCGHTDVCVGACARAASKRAVIAKQIDRLLAEPMEVRSCAN